MLSLKCILMVLVVMGNNAFMSSAWERDVVCPLICTCQLQHLTETAIYRFMQKNKGRTTAGEPGSVENNEVLYDETMDTVELLEETHRSLIVRSVTCILQTETNPMELIDSLPENTESLTFIQGYESGNKTIKFSGLNKFLDLVSLELIGTSRFRNDPTHHMFCQIDSSLVNLSYLNLERVLIKNSKEQIQSFLQVLKENENVTFEYVKKMEGNTHPLTIMQQGNSDEEIMPYEVFKEQRKNSGEEPLFVGFKKLLLLRITNCELNNIHWEMFDGLGELQYLILERNNLRFIPAFTFYGTPVLKLLSLAHNKLLDIELTDLAGLLRLEYLDLTYNNFTQLSELSFPPFPELKLANFANNPVSIIFPNTFQVMNTTDSLIVGSEDIPLTLLPNSFIGLNLLKTLTVNNAVVDLLRRDFFVGMPQLRQLVLTGNISKIEYDAFLEISTLETLILTNCRTYNISMDAFIGLRKLHYLDVSKNLLEYLPSGVFDDLESIKELYLNGNKFKELPSDIFSKIHPKLLRLNDNPWHCSCEMSEWKPILVNRIKQKSIKNCDFTNDKGVGCATLDNRFEYRYVYENKVAPKCSQPEQYKNWSVFHAMRRILKCPEYKPKIKKQTVARNITISTSTRPDDSKNMPELKSTVKPNLKSHKLKSRLRKAKYLKYKLKKHLRIVNRIQSEETDSQSTQIQNEMGNDLNNVLGLNKFENNNLITNNAFNIVSLRKSKLGKL